MQNNDSSPIAVRAEGLGKHFGREWALAHIDLRIRQGEVYLLAGSNGSGKTTLLRLIAGLYKPSRGSLEVFGIKPTGERLTNRANLTLISHHSYLYNRLTALEILRVWSRLRGSRLNNADLIELLETVSLDTKKDRQVGGFSAGMRKRLTLLRVRIEEPKLVLLDEPFSALDPEGQQLVEDWIHGFRDEGRTVIMASHNLLRSGRICNRVLTLDKGQITWKGSGSELLETIGAEVGGAAE